MLKRSFEHRQLVRWWRFKETPPRGVIEVALFPLAPRAICFDLIQIQRYLEVLVMANKPKNGGGLLSPITLPRELMERLANVLARYGALRPRMYPTRSALVREALVRGLDSLEPELV